jgi:hypothetical protein
LLSQPDSSGFEMALAGARRAVPGGGRPGFRFPGRYSHDRRIDGGNGVRGRKRQQIFLLPSTLRQQFSSDVI